MAGRLPRKSGQRRHSVNLLDTARNRRPDDGPADTTPYGGKLRIATAIVGFRAGPTEPDDTPADGNSGEAQQDSIANPMGFLVAGNPNDTQTSDRARNTVYSQHQFVWGAAPVDALHAPLIRLDDLNLIAGREALQIRPIVIHRPAACDQAQPQHNHSKYPLHGSPLQAFAAEVPHQADAKHNMGKIRKSTDKKLLAEAIGADHPEAPLRG